MTAKQLREKYLKFFESKGHKILPSAPLVPENDPTVLFTTAGMQPLVPYLLGEKHPMGNRVCNSQKCVRTGDIDDVGDPTHLTFFEMLGNWSLGDYFKKEAIEWSFEFLTKELNIPLEKLAFTIFEGEPASAKAMAGEGGIPKEVESFEIWRGLGVSEKRIKYLGRDDNWWGPAGATGPCGPDTEMFYWTGGDPIPAVFDPSDKKWVEIWNDVFMQYNKTADGQFIELAQKNVDTGMGLERVAMILQGRDNVYETELFEPIIEKINSICHSEPAGEESHCLGSFGRPRRPQDDDAIVVKSIRVIADHLRASAFILAEGLAPSNIGRGYILRRLIRRAVRYGKLLGIIKEFTGEIAQVVVEMYDDIYPELKENQEFILSELQKEEENFGRTLERGLKEFNKIAIKGNISGKEMFDLYQNYGFPIAITKELAKERGLFISDDSSSSSSLSSSSSSSSSFQEELKKHQELSRTASAGQFKSGLADNSEQTTKYHTATHLMLSALREVLGESVQQKGSNITAERIRFDFSFNRKMTIEEIKKVEDLVNEKIQANLPVVCQEMELAQAKEQGAVGVFGHKYADRVKVYTIGSEENICSKEICAGPHAERTGILGIFKIIKEEASSSGVRRVKAVLL